MKSLYIWVAMAAAGWMGTAAMAGTVQIGSVDVGRRTDVDTVYSGFGGPVEALSFTANRSDIFCNSVVVRYSDGRLDTVVQWRSLEQGRPVFVDVPGRTQRVDNIRFICRSQDRGGRIDIGVDIGRHRDAWQHDRDWQSRWAGLFDPGFSPSDGRRDRDDWRADRHDNGFVPPPRGDRDWLVLNRLSFEGSDDSEQTFGGWRGDNIDRIALRALNHTARCGRVIASFRNGQDVTLAKDRKLGEGDIVVFDLPGRHRDLSNLYLRCHAFGDRQVTIEVLVRK